MLFRSCGDLDIIYASLFAGLLKCEDVLCVFIETAYTSRCPAGSSLAAAENHGSGKKREEATVLKNWVHQISVVRIECLCVL